MRANKSGFAAASYATTPLPEPLVMAGKVNQLFVVNAVQSQPANAVMLTELLTAPAVWVRCAGARR